MDSKECHCSILERLGVQLEITQMNHVWRLHQTRSTLASVMFTRNRISVLNIFRSEHVYACAGRTKETCRPYIHITISWVSSQTMIMRLKERSIRFREHLRRFRECFGRRENDPDRGSSIDTHINEQLDLSEPPVALNCRQLRPQSPPVRQGALKTIGGRIHENKKPRGSPISNFKPVANTITSSSSNRGIARAHRQSQNFSQSSHLEESPRNDSGIECSITTHEAKMPRTVSEFTHLADANITNPNGRTLTVQYSQSWDVPLGQLGYNLTCSEGETYTLPYPQRRQRTPIDPMLRIQELSPNEGKSGSD
jgi:hypothetical protein